MRALGFCRAAFRNCAWNKINMNNSKFKKIFSSFALKVICLVTMITGMILVQLNSPNYREMEEFGWTVSKTTEVLMKLGYNIYYIGVPIACFLLVEGCMKTKNVKKYIWRLFLGAAITEIVFDCAKFGKECIFDFSNGIAQNKALTNTPNFFFTLLVGLICISLMEYGVAKKFKQGTIRYNLFNLLIVLVGVVFAYFAGFEHGGVGVLMIFAFYFFYGNAYLSLIAVAALQIVMLGKASGFFMYTPVLGTIITWFYNGEKGKDGKAVRVMTYTLYALAYVIVVSILKKSGAV